MALVGFEEVLGCGGGKHDQDDGDLKHSTDLMKTASVEQIRQNAYQRFKTDVLDPLDSQMMELVDEVIQDMGTIDGAQNTPNGDLKPPPTQRIKGELPEKTYISRNSILTELLEVDHIRTIYHIFVAILIIVCLQTLISDWLDERSLIPDFELITWTFGKFPLVITLWMAMFGSVTLIVYPLFHHWAVSRAPGAFRWSDMLYLALYVLYQLGLLIFPPRIICQYDLPPASTVIVSCEQVRMIMKVHAFVRTNISRALAYKPHSDDEAPTDGPCPDFGKYLYFLFAPTIVYRDTYPRSASIRWYYVFTNLLQVVACMIYVQYVFARFCVPHFQHFNHESISLKSIILSCFGSMLPGTLVLFIAFFAILHSWLNAFAEMLRFGDRLFYKDWWNSTSFANYYRTWNVVVHDWLYTYIYKEVCLFLPRQSRPLGMALVFLISAIVHEYILTVTFRFFYPVLFFMFAGAGFAFVFVNHSGYKRSGNIFMWVMLFMGTGMLMCLYSMEWYARKNCPHTTESLIDYLIPRSWSCEQFLEGI